MLTHHRLSTDPTAQPPRLGEPLPLVDIIELKWLLAGVGIHIHVERLQSDPAYALRALAEAEDCASPPARAAAIRLRSRLAPAA